VPPPGFSAILNSGRTQASCPTTALLARLQGKHSFFVELHSNNGHAHFKERDSMNVAFLRTMILMGKLLLLASPVMGQTGPGAPPAVGVITAQKRPMAESTEINGRIALHMNTISTPAPAA
jgi:hypothetical protein